MSSERKFKLSWLHCIIAFQTVSSAKVDKLIKDLSSKQCELDSMPIYAHLAPQIPSFSLCAYSCLINKHFLITGPYLLDPQKRATIRPRIKKPGLILQTLQVRPTAQLPICPLFQSLRTCPPSSTLQVYVEEINLLSPTQSGFRRHQSTETAVVKVYIDTVLALDSSLITALFSCTLVQTLTAWIMPSLYV